VRHDAISANPVRETDTVAKTRGEILVLDDAGLAELRAILNRWQRGLDKHTGEAVYTTRPRADDILDVVDRSSPPEPASANCSRCAGAT
jgi:hypothetical protein